MNKPGAEPTHPREAISACIICCNEESNIRRCLESVWWADEIVVVDSFSSDRTVAIAREYTQRVYQHRWLGYIGQKALTKRLAKGPWVLFVDADEEVSDRLRREIAGLFEAGVSEATAGFEFPRMVWYLGRWIRHGEWYPDVKLRLFRKDRGECVGAEPHERVDVKGGVRRLRSPLLHYTYDDLADQVNTLNRFSSISSRSRYEAGTRMALPRMLFHPPFRFFRSYILKRGFLDGIPGLIIAQAASFGTFVKYAKLWELQRTNRRSGGPSA